LYLVWKRFQSPPVLALCLPEVTSSSFEVVNRNGNNMLIPLRSNSVIVTMSWRHLWTEQKCLWKGATGVPDTLTRQIQLSWSGWARTNVGYRGSLTPPMFPGNTYLPKSRDHSVGTTGGGEGVVCNNFVLLTLLQRSIMQQIRAHWKGVAQSAFEKRLIMTKSKPNSVSKDVK
jgi:hypothetical protein